MIFNRPSAGLNLQFIGDLYWQVIWQVYLPISRFIGFAYNWDSNLRFDYFLFLFARARSDVAARARKKKKKKLHAMVSPKVAGCRPEFQFIGIHYWQVIIR